MSASTSLNSYPGQMKISVSPWNGSRSGFMAIVSSERRLVVPTATTRPPFFFVSVIMSHVFLLTDIHSECIECSFMLSTFTALKVPNPTCKVTKQELIPLFFRRSNKGSSKWSPAVGAAIAPGAEAYTV